MTTPTPPDDPAALHAARFHAECIAVVTDLSVLLGQFVAKFADAEDRLAATERRLDAVEQMFGGVR